MPLLYNYYSGVTALLVKLAMNVTVDELAVLQQQQVSSPSHSTAVVETYLNHSLLRTCDTVMLPFSILGLAIERSSGCAGHPHIVACLPDSFHIMHALGAHTQHVHHGPC